MNTLEKKRQIVDYFLKKSVLLEPSELMLLNNPEKTDEAYTLIEKQEIENFSELQKKMDTGGAAGVEVLQSYGENSEKKTVEKFVEYFNLRYKAIQPMLSIRPELREASSIKRILSKKQKEQAAFIGIVLEKAETKNRNIILTLEDPTGIMKVIIHKNRRDLLTIAGNIVNDEVIGVIGNVGDNIVFANSIIFPDVPMTKELKKSPDEAYAVFTSDHHFGSKNFLKENFEKFISWMNGEIGNESQKEIARKTKYFFLVGDLVDGVGIYPGQERDLEKTDIREQYNLLAETLLKVPKHIQIIISPGNHDAVRIEDPQPAIDKAYAEKLYEIPNITFVSNPSIVNIHKTANFPGFDILIYHGYSFPYYADKVPSISEKGGLERIDLVMKLLLQKRHLAPSHESALKLPGYPKDPLVIEKIPDFLVTGHVHRAVAVNYRNVTLINSSCWLAETEYQKKVGLVPEPGRIAIVNLQTREVKFVKF